MKQTDKNDDAGRKTLFAALKDNARKAAAMLSALERKGDVDGHFLQGLRQRGGRSPEAAQRAFACFKKASGAGHAYARVYLAEAYQQGRGIKKNRLTARRRLEESAAAGCIGAMACLANHYLDANPTKREAKEGLRWLTRAAGHTIGRIVLAEPRLEDYGDLDEFMAGLDAFWTVEAHEHLALRYDEGVPGQKRKPEQAAVFLDRVFRAGYRENAWELCRLYDEIGESGESERVLDVLIGEGDVEAMKVLGNRLKAHGNSRERSIRGLQLLDRAARTPVKQAPVEAPPKARALAAPKRLSSVYRSPLLEARERLMGQAEAYFDTGEFRLCIRILHGKSELTEYEPAKRMRAMLRKLLGDNAYESHLIIYALP